MVCFFVIFMHMFVLRPCGGNQVKTCKVTGVKDFSGVPVLKKKKTLRWETIGAKKKNESRTPDLALTQRNVSLITVVCDPSGLQCG